MSIVKYYSPELRRMRKRHVHHTGVPATDVIESDEQYTVSVNLPGFSKDDISIEADYEYITITAEQKEEEEKETPNFLHRERFHKKFARKIGFRKPVNAKDAKITLANGVLTIEIPIAEESKAVKLSIN
ncbi:MAG: Hsp20/alpha crystallin family protein [Candidatus Kariarchaeaceae archaeon]